MNVKQLLALAYLTPDDVTEFDTPVGKVGYALAGTVVIRAMEDNVSAENGADVFVHQHDTADDARECYTLMVAEVGAVLDSDVMSRFADALARTATPRDMFSV
jgi:hypothetical protein